MSSFRTQSKLEDLPEFKASLSYSYHLKFLGRLSWPSEQEKPVLHEDFFLQKSELSSLLSP